MADARQGEATREHATRGYAAIVLAAGAATRMGRPKQVEPVGGRPLVCWAAGAALEAGLEPVVVVTGAAAREVEAALAGLPVRVVHNPRYSGGMGTSVAVGAAELDTAEGPVGPLRGAVVMLADQPLVPPALLRALVAAHEPPTWTVVRPGYPSGRLAPPALFDRCHFAELAALEGDRGASQVILRHPGVTRVVPWPDDLPLLDVDTPAELEALRERLRALRGPEGPGAGHGAP